MIGFSVLLDHNFFNSFIFSLSFIMIGFIFKRVNLFKENSKEFLSKLLMTLTIPCMAFDAFMCDFSIASFKNNFSIFIFSFLVFLLLILFFRLIIHFFDKENDKLYAVICIFGQMTLFSIPILKVLYPNNNEMLIASNMLTISFRLYLYIYAFLIVSKTKINKQNTKLIVKNLFLNPIMIMMFLGLFIYLTQNIMIKIDGKSLLRLDLTLPSVYQIIHTLSSMTTPLAMILIGITLGNANFKEAIKNKKAYLFAFCKSFITPLIVLLIALFCNLIHLTNYSTIQLIVLTLCFAAPLSAVVNSYCVAYHQQEYLSSDVCFLSTIMALLTMPLLILLIQVI